MAHKIDCLNFFNHAASLTHPVFKAETSMLLWRGLFPEAPELPTIKITVLNIAKWLDEERPGLEFVEDYEEEVTDDYTDPDKEYSTELGQVPQAAEKGSIRPSLTRGPYGLSLYNYYGY